jgi:hypothetical protein
VVAVCRYSPILDASLPGLIRSVKEQGLEGLVAKRRDSKYEPGLRSGAWQKMRVNRSDQLVIAGYTPSLNNFDALIVGYYEGDKLIYAARTRSGFTPLGPTRAIRCGLTMQRLRLLRGVGVSRSWSRPGTGASRWSGATSAMAVCSGRIALGSWGFRWLS